MFARLRRLGEICVLGLVFGGFSFSQQLTRDFLDNTVIHDIRIDLDPNEWVTLKQNYLNDTYYHADVSSGAMAAADVGIRSRGRGSRSPNKPNLDVNIDKYTKKQRFAGLGFFVLKANNQDASLMHEAVAFALFRKMGLPAPREAPARLYINGEYFGFYTIVEREDEDFLNRNLGEDGGDLFEWKPNAFYHFEDLGDDPAPYANLLDPKTNEDDPDYQKFIDMVKAINHSLDADFVNAVSPYLDLKLYLTHAATENTLAELDGIWDGVYGTNNIYLYRFEGQDLFHFLTWDKDLTFLQPQRELPQAANNVLVRRVLAIPEYRNFYLSQLAKAADLLGGSGGWADQEVSRMYALFRDAARDDPHKQCLQDNGRPPAPCGPEAFEQGVRDMRAFIAARPAFVKNTLAQQNYQPPADAPVIDSVTPGEPGGGTEIAPGSLVRIRGIYLGEDMVSISSSLPRSSGRSFVAVEGVRAPIVSMSPSEALVQIPSDIPAGTAAIAVAADGALSNTVEAPVAPAAPDIPAAIPTPVVVR
jgi:hypothetical protein